jgi:hypothetical protein
MLGQLLASEQRGGLLPLMCVATGSTVLMPHAGTAAGSTTSEGATAGITAACAEVVAQLRPYAAVTRAEGEEVTWQALVKHVCSWEVLKTKVGGWVSLGPVRLSRSAVSVDVGVVRVSVCLLRLVQEPHNTHTHTHTHTQAPSWQCNSCICWKVKRRVALS